VARVLKIMLRSWEDWISGDWARSMVAFTREGERTLPSEERASARTDMLGLVRNVERMESYYTKRGE
jgi:hypothetical protein